MHPEPFDRSHLASFKPGEHDRDNTLALESHDWTGKAVSLRYEGRTLAIFGLAVRDGTGHAWLVLSDEMRLRAVLLCRMARAVLPVIFREHNINELKIEVDHPRARRWAEWLGFEGEGKWLTLKRRWR